MKTVAKVSCIGELLVDFISIKSGVDLVGAPGFMKFAGGACANVAVGLAKLGIRSAFVGKVGNDSFGKFLRDQLQQAGVDTSGLRFDEDHKTRLAFVSLTNSGERDFAFWEQHPADEQLHLSDININQIAKSTIVHISSFLLLNEPSRSTALQIAKEVRRCGCEVSFDPNLRLSLLKSHAEAKRFLLQMVKLSTMLRLNEEEARFLTDSRNLQTAAIKLCSLGPSLVVVTLGSKGCYFHTPQSSSFVDGFNVKAVDTTGCGDGFLAGFLSGIVNACCHLRELSTDALYSICNFGNAVGALTATKRGVISALPSSSQVRKFLSAQRTSQR